MVPDNNHVINQGTQELISNEELAITDTNSRLSAVHDKTEEYRPLANHGAVIVEVISVANLMFYSGTTCLQGFILRGNEKQGPEKCYQ